MYIGCRQKEGITLKTSALQTLYGQFKLSTQPIKPNYLGIPTPPSPLTPPTQHHSFFRNIPPSYFSLSDLTWIKEQRKKTEKVTQIFFKWTIRYS